MTDSYEHQNIQVGKGGARVEFESPHGKVSLFIYQYGRGVGVEIEGYGDSVSAKGHGQPLLLDLDLSYPPTVHIWSDINQEDSTHEIELTGAREAARS